MPTLLCCQHTVHGFPNVTFNVTEGARLQTTFGVNVKGVSRFTPLVLPGTISVMENSASKGQSYLELSHFYLLEISISHSYSIASQDYQHFREVTTSETGATSVTFITWDDEISLEYDDSVNLTFTPENQHLLDGIEAAGEFVRHAATVNIIDTDSQYIILFHTTTYIHCLLIELGIYFEQRVYSVREDGTLTTPIRMRFDKATQTSFTLTVTAVSNENTESLGISSFISDSVTTDNATLGRF